MAVERPRLIFIGSGARAYREHLFAALSDHYELAQVERDYPTWQKRYVSTHRIAALSDATVLFPAVADLRGEVASAGVLTVDEQALPAAGEVTRKLGLRHVSADAARTCQDAYALRAALRDAELPGVQAHLARTEDEAVAAAEVTGFPVLVRPRIAPGTSRAVIAPDLGSLREAFRQAKPARPGSDAPAGVVVEEYPDGPCLSVDSVVTDGLARVVAVARKERRPDSADEAAGYLVSPWLGEPWADSVSNLVEAAHRAVGIDWGVTRTEVRITGRGPRILAIVPAIGGDLLPMAVKAATGTDLIQAAAAIAFDAEPDLSPAGAGSAGIRFLHTSAKGAVERVELPAAGAVPGLAAAVALVQPGDLPGSGDQAASRYAALIAVGASPDEVRGILDRAAGLSAVHQAVG